MNNIYDIFNNRKNEIECISESAGIVEDEFDSIEEGLEYMDELLQESSDDMIEWQAACYMEDLVLEQMMYESFNASEMEFIIEGSLKERFSGLGKSLSDLWEKIKTWFKTMMSKIQDHILSGGKLVEKYSEGEIQNALKKSELSVKFPELGNPKNAAAKFGAAIRKLEGINPDGLKGAYQEAVISHTELGASDEKGLMTAIKKLIFPLESKSITKVNSLDAKTLMTYANYGFIKEKMEEAYKCNEKTFKRALANAKGAHQAKKDGDVGGQVYYYVLTLRQKMLSAYLGAYKQAASACRAIIIKVMAGGSAVKESALMEEYLDEGFVNRMKMKKMSKEEMDEKIADIEGKIAEIEGKEEQDKKDAKELKKLRKQLADVKKVKGKKHPDPVEESINWDEYDYLDEGLRDKINSAKAKHGEKKNNRQINKKEKQIEILRNRIEELKANYEKEEQRLQNKKDKRLQTIKDDISDLDEEIEEFKREIEELKAKQNPVQQESYFDFDDEYDELEEGFVNRMKMKKMSKEEMDEKIADIEGKIAEIEGKEEQDKKDAKELKKLRKQLADVKKVKGKKHPDPVEESWGIIDDVEFLD